MPPPPLGQFQEGVGQSPGAGESWGHVETDRPQIGLPNSGTPNSGTPSRSPQDTRHRTPPGSGSPLCVEMRSVPARPGGGFPLDHSAHPHPPEDGAVHQGPSRLLAPQEGNCSPWFALNGLGLGTSPAWRTLGVAPAAEVASMGAPLL